MDVEKWAAEARTLGLDEARDALETLRMQASHLLDCCDGMIEDIKRVGRAEERRPIVARWIKSNARYRKSIMGGE